MAHLRRSPNAILDGVCGGIAERLGWEATLVRVLCVLIFNFQCGGSRHHRVSDFMGRYAENLNKPTSPKEKPLQKRLNTAIITTIH